MVPPVSLIELAAEEGRKGGVDAQPPPGGQDLEGGAPAPDLDGRNKEEEAVVAHGECFNFI